MSTKVANFCLLLFALALTQLTSAGAVAGSNVFAVMGDVPTITVKPYTLIHVTHDPQGTEEIEWYDFQVLSVEDGEIINIEYREAVANDGQKEWVFTGPPAKYSAFLLIKYKDNPRLRRVEQRIEVLPANHPAPDNPDKPDVPDNPDPYTPPKPDTPTIPDGTYKLGQFAYDLKVSTLKKEDREAGVPAITAIFVEIKERMQGKSETDPSKVIPVEKLIPSIEAAFAEIRNLTDSPDYFPQRLRDAFKTGGFNDKLGEKLGSLMPASKDEFIVMLGEIITGLKVE